MSTLNIYGQRKWHDDVLIVGDRKALLNLASALSAAAKNETVLVPVNVMASDGEEYRVLCQCVASLEDSRVPYTDPDAASNEGTDPQRCFP